LSENRTEDTLLTRTTIISIAALAAALLFLFASLHNSASAATALPDPTVDDKLTPQAGDAKLVLGGGCFWGLQAVYEHVIGVNHVTAGYAGGTVKNPSYEQVSSGETGHAESIEIDYDPSKITLGTLLKIFFSVAHDPTQLNRQGPDTGTQYRSIIFFNSDDQRRIAEAYIKQLGDTKIFSGRIVTQVVPYQAFYRAEDYHQDYAAHHPENPYIAICDAPKVKRPKEEFPNLYREENRK
jgi:peptide-methionine (S)-S-oxide reductase